MSPKVGMGPVRREQIVRATIRCLAREGYTRLTMKKVAREAGVSQGILHYYFEDKRAMLAATLEVVTRDLDRRYSATKTGELDSDYFRTKFGVDVSTEYSATWSELRQAGLLEKPINHLTPDGFLQIDRYLPTFFEPQYRDRRYT